MDDYALAVQDELELINEQQVTYNNRLSVPVTRSSFPSGNVSLSNENVEIICCGQSTIASG